MLPLALINLSRLHWSGTRTQVHQQDDATGSEEESKQPLPDLNSIYEQHFYFRTSEWVPEGSQ
jgi:hypothetical protein